MKSLLICMLAGSAGRAIAESPAESSSRAARPDVASGCLLIAGGGNLGEEIWQTFAAAAGGVEGKIVIIVTAKEVAELAGHTEATALRAAGAKDITILHTLDRGLAASEGFLAPLRSATGVWFTGGRQWRLVDAYAGTPVVTECFQVLSRGGVVGGSSAGATIQGEYLVRGDPGSNTIVMAPGYEQGFGFLPGTAIDQHFTQRNRLADLLSVKQAHPRLVCLGIDEGTAILVRQSKAELIGAGTVTIYDAPPDADGNEQRSARIVMSGQSYDFRTRQVTGAASPAAGQDDGRR